jgi:GTPase SAR1 family protein
MSVLNSVKVVIVGDSQVGKTSYVKAVCNSDNQLGDGCDVGDDVYVYTPTPTRGVDIKRITISNNDGTHTRFNIWDCAGNCFGDITLYPEIGNDTTGNVVNRLKADALFLMFDLTNRLTFEHCKNWIQVVKEIYDDIDDIPIILIGTKFDITPDIVNTVNAHEIRAFMHQYPSISFKFFYISAKLNHNILGPFEYLSHVLNFKVTPNSINNTTSFTKTKNITIVNAIKEFIPLPQSITFEEIILLDIRTLSII